MATTTNVTSTYQGEFAGKYIASALLSANTIDKGGITVMPNVKYKAVVKKLAVSDVLADADCDFQATSTVTLTERIIEPKALKVNLQLCKAEYRSHRVAITMGYSAFDELPKSFADFLIGHVSAKVSLKMEQNIWSGDKNNAGEFDGLLQLLSVDADLPTAIDIASATVSAASFDSLLGYL